MEGNKKKQNNSKETENYMAEDLSLGICLGTALGAIIGNMFNNVKGIR